MSQVLTRHLGRISIGFTALVLIMAVLSLLAAPIYAGRFSPAVPVLPTTLQPLVRATSQPMETGRRVAYGPSSVTVSGKPVVTFPASLPTTLQPLPVTYQRPWHIGTSIPTKPIVNKPPATRWKAGHERSISFKPHTPEYSITSYKPLSFAPATSAAYIADESPSLTPEAVHSEAVYKAAVRQVARDPASSRTVERSVRKPRSIAVPAQTVMYVALSNTLNSKRAQVGDPVIVTVMEPVYVGPYLVIPAGAEVTGEVTALNRRHEVMGPNPYIVVNFSQLHRPGDNQSCPINAELIAYKTGFKKSDYLWKLPEKRHPFKLYAGAAAEGALTGFFANPVMGPPIGAAVNMLAAFTKEKIAHRGTVAIKSGTVIPVAVQQAFRITVVPENAALASAHDN